MLKKPRLQFVDSTRQSITLRSETELKQEGIIYKIEVQDKTYGWIVKYWGLKSECTIKGLGPEQVYYFRLGVCRRLDEEQAWSDILPAATKFGPPRLFHLFNSVERKDLQGLRNFLAERKETSVIDAFDKNGETALIKAVSGDDISSVSLLLTSGASVNQGAHGTRRTPLMYAAYRGHINIAQLLIEKGANISAVDGHLCQPLHYAVDSSHLEMVTYLLSFPLDVNMTDSAGWTPLMRAVVLGASVEVVQELLSHQPNIYKKDRSGQSCLDLARLAEEDTGLLAVLQAYERTLQPSVQEEHVEGKEEIDKDDKEGVKKEELNKYQKDNEQSNNVLQQKV